MRIAFEAPSSPTIAAVIEFARAACPPFLMGHNHRTFMFGRLLVGGDFDEEVAYVAAMLHDIGLVDEHIGSTSFELVGAEVAARFLEMHAWPVSRIRLVEQAIIRHIELVPHDIPELRLVQAGAAFDVAGIPAHALHTAETATILAAHPRGATGLSLRELILAEIERQPAGAFARLEEQISLSSLVVQNQLDMLG
jgi:hypothetical protein